MLNLYMAWLPYEDKIAGKSEELVLKYSPARSGAGKPVLCKSQFCLYLDVLLNFTNRKDIKYDQ